MKVYVAGPMSGRPAFNIPVFDAAAAALRAAGHDVVSPAEVDGEADRAILLQSPDGNHADLPEWASHMDYLTRDLEILRTGGFDAIVCLPGWERSPGANREVGYGLGLGIERLDYDETREDLGVRFIPHDENPLRQRASTGAVKDNLGKTRVELIPTEPLEAVGRVLGFGAKKYKPNNWRLGLSWLQTLGSALRHIYAFARGEDIDPESGECHIDNAITQLMFLSTYWHTKTGSDDRWSSLQSEDKEAAKA